MRGLENQVTAFLLVCKLVNTLLKSALGDQPVHCQGTVC